MYSTERGHKGSHRLAARDEKSGTYGIVIVSLIFYGNFLNFFSNFIPFFSNTLKTCFSHLESLTSSNLFCIFNAVFGLVGE